MEPEVFALVLILLFIVFALALPRLIRSLRRDVAKVAPTLPRPPTRPAGYDWDRRTHQAYRKFKGIEGPSEQRGQITSFLDTHDGVEAYVEPKTVMDPLSVVLVDGDGAWRRFELAEDTYLRELARTRDVKIIDAARFGYPKRMRRDQGRLDRLKPMSENESKRCPVCGQGTLVQIEFGEQQPASPQVETYTCGHEVRGERLDTADADALDVERRTSDETVVPIADDEPEGS